MGPFAYRSWVEISLKQIADNFNAVRSVVRPAAVARRRKDGPRAVNVSGGPEHSTRAAGQQLFG